MDILFFVIAIFVFYVLPELLKRRQKKEYKYPEIPDRSTTENQERIKPFPAEANQTVIPYPAPQEEVAAKEHAAENKQLVKQPALPVDEDQIQILKHGSFNANAVRAGIIYAEILKPPKALRKWQKFNH